MEKKARFLGVLGDLVVQAVFPMFIASPLRLAPNRCGLPAAALQP